jgi:hypothetical protein
VVAVEQLLFLLLVVVVEATSPMIQILQLMEKLILAVVAEVDGLEVLFPVKTAALVLSSSNGHNL